MIAAIETAILARLAAAGGTDPGKLGYSFRWLESYPDDWDSYLAAKGEWRGCAAWVVFAGFGKAERSDTGAVIVPANFFVVVAAENSRNETARRHGGPVAAEPGSYQLMLDVLALLSYSDLGLDLNAPLVPGRTRLVRNPEQLKLRNVSMYAIEFATEFEIATVAEPDQRAPGLFSAFHVNWDIPAFGNVGPAIPDDDNADATDHLELPQ